MATVVLTVNPLADESATSAVAGHEHAIRARMAATNVGFIRTIIERFCFTRARRTCYLPFFMASINLLVISNPAAPHLRVLDKIRQPVNKRVGQELEFVTQEAPNAEVILCANFKPEPFRTVFPMAKRLAWVHSSSAGVENLLFPEFVASPVPLTNGRGVFKDSLAEFAVSAMLFFVKDLRRMVRNQEAGRWEQFDTRMLSGQTLGVVGYGEIGRATAQLARCLGMRVLAVRRQPERSQDDSNIAAVYAPGGLREMLGLCDFVLVAAPHTPETRGLIGGAELRAMKSNAVIINVGRGPVIVEAALIEALQANRIGGAALDVFDHEPLPEGHPFYRLPNVLLSPHCADHTAGWIEMAMETFVENFERYRNGHELKNIVDKKAGY